MSTALVSRLFHLAGMDPGAGMPILRPLARCPRERLVRIVSWCAWECGHGVPAVNDLLGGVRALARGWDDYYLTTTLPSGAALVKAEGLGEPGVALVSRRGRIGRGWWKEDVMTRGPVRADIELGTRWLGSLAGCVVHDDCVAIPELGLACAASARR
jgi:hypothetical protein